MFTVAHKFVATTLYVCAVTLLLFLTHSVFAEEISDQDTSPTEASTSDAISADSLNSNPDEMGNARPYTTEVIPGGGYVAGDFVVGPGKIDVTIEPGETKTVQMTVTNRTGELRRFNLTIEDASGSEDPTQGIVLLGDDRGPYSIKDFITVPARTFELAHNERAIIPVTVHIPRDAEPGGRYGSVLVDTVAIESDTGVSKDTIPQSAIVARIGTLFFVTIPGASDHEGRLVDFGTVPPQKFFQKGPISLGLLFENKGSIHLAPYGEIRITNMLGEDVGYVELEPWFILPQSNRLREVTWNRDFLFGRYTATAKINRSYDDIIDERSYSFWVLPWTLLVAGFATIFIVIFLIRLFFKKFEFKRK